MGFERITAVLQGKTSNYDTDVFTPIFAAIQKVTEAAPYTGKLDDLKDTAYRVIADHIRTLTFALTDGAHAGNEGRGYVSCAASCGGPSATAGSTSARREPFLHKLVPAVVEHMGDAFPELKRDPEKVAATILRRGGELPPDAGPRHRSCSTRPPRTRAKRRQGRSARKDAFELHDTYGFFIDITEQMAAEAGLTRRSGRLRAS